MADGDDIREYMTATARKHGIDTHIRFGSLVRSANWDSATDTWTVQRSRTACARPTAPGSCSSAAATTTTTSATPRLPGNRGFAGNVVHPQLWPEDFDYTGQKLVVIGSGATAISMIPSLAGTPRRSRCCSVHLILCRQGRRIPSSKRFGKFCRAECPTVTREWSCRCCGGRCLAVSRQVPELMRSVCFARGAMNNLPAGYPVDTHFKPPLQPVGSADVLHRSTAISSRRSARATSRW